MGQETSVIQGQRAVVTGGAGFIGSHVVDLLLEQGADRVIILDNLSRGREENLPNDRRVVFMQDDLMDAPYRRLPLKEGDLVFHLAAKPLHFCQGNPRLAVAEMATGTQWFFEECSAANVAKVIFSSSASVYGMAETFPTKEDHHPYGNSTLYGWLKLFGEGMLAYYGDNAGLKSVSLRYFNVYGPRMAADGAYTAVFIKWLRKLDEGKPPTVFGDQTMDLVYVGDVARANVMAAETDAADGAVLNIAGGQEVGLLEIAKQMSLLSGGPQPEYIETADIMMPRRLASVELAEKLLGWHPEIGYLEGMKRTMEWWRAR